MALPQKNRLKTKKEIDYVFTNGRTVKGSSLFIRLLNNQKGYSRVTFIVPAKNIRLAVDRNKVKRILSSKVREGYFLEKHYDMIVVITKKIIRKELGGLPQELEQLLSKI